MSHMSPGSVAYKHSSTLCSESTPGKSASAYRARSSQLCLNITTRRASIPAKRRATRPRLRDSTSLTFPKQWVRPHLPTRFTIRHIKRMWPFQCRVYFAKTYTDTKPSIQQGQRSRRKGVKLLLGRCRVISQQRGEHLNFRLQSSPQSLSPMHTLSII